jgi:hypothetical protein
VRAGTGDPRWPAHEGEEMEAYLRRLADELGRTVVTPRAPAADYWYTERDAGEDRD